MAEPARELPTTFDEFLAWDDGTDTRYEFVRGRPVAMSPPASPHAVIAHNAGSAIERALGDASPCSVAQGAGIMVEDGADQRFYVADVAMTCAEITNAPYLPSPRLIVEILSRTTEGYDKKRKVPDYCRLPSAEEVWLVDSRDRWVMVWQRVDGQWIGSIPFTGSQRFDSRVLASGVELDRLYRNVRFDEDEAAAEGR